MGKKKALIKFSNRSKNCGQKYEDCYSGCLCVHVNHLQDLTAHIHSSGFVVVNRSNIRMIANTLPENTAIIGFWEELKTIKKIQMPDITRTISEVKFENCYIIITSTGYFTHASISSIYKSISYNEEIRFVLFQTDVNGLKYIRDITNKTTDYILVLLMDWVCDLLEQHSYKDVNWYTCDKSGYWNSFEYSRDLKHIYSKTWNLITRYVPSLQDLTALFIIKDETRYNTIMKEVATSPVVEVLKKHHD